MLCSYIRASQSTPFLQTDSSGCPVCGVDKKGNCADCNLYRGHSTHGPLGGGVGTPFHFEMICVIKAQSGSIPAAVTPTAALWPPHWEEKEGRVEGEGCSTSSLSVTGRTQEGFL